MDINQNLAKINGEQFFRKYVPSLKNTNGTGDAKGTCPFHTDKTPSFSVNFNKKVFRCFGACGEKGGIIAFVKKKWGLNTNAEAWRILEDEDWIQASKKPQPKKDSSVKNKEKKEPNYLHLDQIKALHYQFLKNKPRLNNFMEKYGLNLDTINQYYLGWQPDFYVIPREVKANQWTYKNHKGYQLTGTQVGLYPSNNIKNDGTVIITEGEYPALILLQNGFSAVSGTGGADTWRPEWSNKLRGHDVVFAYDNDEPGEKGAAKAIESLIDYARSTRVIKWPPFMAHKEDPNDFFVIHGKTKADFQKLIDDAREINKEMKEVDGIKFVEPVGFSVQNNEIQYKDYYKKEGVSPIMLHTTLFITGRAIDVDTNTEDVQLTFKRDGELKRVWATRITVADARKIIELSDTGLAVNSCNSKRVVEYLAAYEAANMSRIPKKLISRGLGWKILKNKRVFLLGDKHNKQSAKGDNDIQVELKTEPGYERLMKALNPHGSYDKWVAAIKPAMKFPYVCFAVYASFAAPLLRTLKAPNFIIDSNGLTSLGKTSLLEITASPWGCPHKEAGGIVIPWDSTKVYLERIASFFCDMPIFVDDSQTVDDKTLRNMLYQVANGMGKGRGSTTGVRYTPSWHTICFSTGEKPLTECTTFAGARARTVELYGSPFPNAGADFVNNLKNEVRENYGHAGSRYITGLCSLLDNELEVKRLVDKYKNYSKKLTKLANTEIGSRHAQYFAVVMVAADVVSQTLGFGDLEVDKENIEGLFNDLINDALSESDFAAQAMEFIISWARSNENSFAKQDQEAEQDIRESYGLWKEGEFIGIFPHKFADTLKAKGFSDRIVRKCWADKKWLERSGNSLTVTKRISYRGTVAKTARFITIPWEIVKKFSQEE